MGHSKYFAFGCPRGQAHRVCRQAASHQRHGNGERAALHQSEPQGSQVTRGQGTVLHQFQRQGKRFPRVTVQHQAARCTQPRKYVGLQRSELIMAQPQDAAQGQSIKYTCLQSGQQVIVQQ